MQIKYYGGPKDGQDSGYSQEDGERAIARHPERPDWWPAESDGEWGYILRRSTDGLLQFKGVTKDAWIRSTEPPQAQSDL